MKIMTKRNKIFSVENLIRLIVVIGLIAFASTKYKLHNILLGLSVIVGIAIIIACIVRLYQELKDYSRTKKWELEIKKTLLVVLLPVVLSGSLLLFAPQKIKNYAIILCSVVLLVLFIYDLIKGGLQGR